MFLANFYGNPTPFSTTFDNVTWFQKDSTFVNIMDYIFLIIVILGQSNELLDLRFRLGYFEFNVSVLSRISIGIFSNHSI